MRIVTWNCNGAFRKKLDALEQFNADIYVIQECEDPERSTSAYKAWAGDYLWAGDNKNRGLGVFAKHGKHLNRLDWYGTYRIAGLSGTHKSASWNTGELRLFLPFTVDSYRILAAWTKGGDDQVFGYVGQLWKYLQIHREELSKPNTAIIGDLNSNAIWDKSDRWWSHSGVVTELEALGLRSLYHFKHHIPQGEESEPTFFHRRDTSRPYHIDYVFLADNLVQSSTIEISSTPDWLELSDHLPIVAQLP